MLKVSGLSIVYGGLRALDRVSLEVQQAEFVAIVGPNGAGKTTLLKAISGAVPAAGGQIEYRGRDIGRLSAAARARLGIAHVPEGRKVFPSLTVLENLEMGSYRTEAKRRRAEGLEMVFGLFPPLRERQRELAGTLSGGQQQMLALGRGLMAQPDLLLLDEPSQGLAPRLVESIFDAVARIRQARSLTILLVEQRVVEAVEQCDRAYVLETGRIVLEGDRGKLLADPRVQRAYLGR
jgi:branched-chain amino acid transport system ATP-binding protein